MGTTSIEDVAGANPQGRNWFQLYMWKDRDRSMALVERAAAAGYDTLLVTVDVPVAGARLRDKRNGMSIPPALTLRHRHQRAAPPAMVDRLPDHRTAGVRLAGSLVWHCRRTAGHHVRPDASPSRISAWIKAQWPGKVVVKGIQTLADAREVVDIGVDGILLSNHGGRQLDRAPIPFHLLPEVGRRGRE